MKHSVSISAATGQMVSMDSPQSIMQSTLCSYLKAGTAIDFNGPVGRPAMADVLLTSLTTAVTCVGRRHASLKRRKKREGEQSISLCRSFGDLSA